ncbi:hypothetical protein G5V65_07100 [Rhodobacter sp. HX-7-19]|uniref:Uncharacterized protein n=1 Tax=Paragemmobacter kunshanensis TaxID=2583234 RepID=A0A6M1TRY3_9RHOB|nr:hypothetical protein [Rhodobacter kunshanensis]NGQ90660.1 hypothetical protein [Rhodobacter kunshanensis]
MIAAGALWTQRITGSVSPEPSHQLQVPATITVTNIATVGGWKIGDDEFKSRVTKMTNSSFRAWP